MSRLYDIPKPPPRLKERGVVKREKTPAQKRPGNDPAYLNKVRELPCCVCGIYPVEAHHIKSAGGRGIGKRTDDKWAIPLCHDHHINGVERVGSRKEVQWFSKYGINPIELAQGLYASRHSVEAMYRVLEAHRG